MSILRKFADDDAFDIVSDCVDQIFQGDEVYDKSTTTKDEIKQFIDSLTREQFEKLTKFFETIPKLEYTFKVKNPKTEVVSEYTIEGLANFFG